MSILFPTLGAVALFAATAAQARKQKSLLATEPEQSATPDDGVYRPWNTIANSQGHYLNAYRSVKRDTDVRGIPVFLVDYGNGAKVYQYHHPDER